MRIRSCVEIVIVENYHLAGCKKAIGKLVNFVPDPDRDVPSV